MRNMLCTMAAAMLIATSSSLAFAQDQSTVWPNHGAANPPNYRNASPQQQPGYGSNFTGARAFGQPSLTQGMPGGNQPSASSHLAPG